MWKEPFGCREGISFLDPMIAVGRKLGGMSTLLGTLSQASEKLVTEISCVQVLSLDLQCSLVDEAAWSQLGYGELEEETVSSLGQCCQMESNVFTL